MVRKFPSFMESKEFFDYLSTGSENSPWPWQIKHSAYSALHNPILLLTLISPYILTLIFLD
jgi:hypothetical protein